MPNTPGQEEIHSFRNWASSPHTPTRGSHMPNETGKHFSQHHEYRLDSKQTAYGNTQHDAGYGDGLATSYSIYDVSPHPDASVVPPGSIYQRHDDETKLLQEKPGFPSCHHEVKSSTVPTKALQLRLLAMAMEEIMEHVPMPTLRRCMCCFPSLLLLVSRRAASHGPNQDDALWNDVSLRSESRPKRRGHRGFQTAGMDNGPKTVHDCGRLGCLVLGYGGLTGCDELGDGSKCKSGGVTSGVCLMTILTSCPEVRTLNLTFEETYEWRQPPKIDRLFEIPLSLWNTTKEPENDTPGWFDYYTAPSPSFQNTATIGSFLEEAVMRRNAPIETCGTGWNCSFEIQFIAPAYKCTELGNGVDSNVNNLTQESGSIAPPFNMDVLLPRGKFTYYAFTSGGEYSTTQMKEVGIGGRPTTNPPFPKHLGAFRTEPIIWLGYVTLADALAKANDTRGSLSSVPSNPSDSAWNTSFVPHIFACENYESNYTVRINYTGAAQTTTVTNVAYLRPVINTTYTPHMDANDGTADNVTATPTDNYILPTSVPQYRRTAAYHSLGFMLRDQINGTVGIGDDRDLVNPIANTKAIQTSRLLDFGNNYFPYPDIQRRIQKFYEDIILSVLGHPQFASVVWAAKSGEQSGVTFDAPDANQPSLLTTDQQRAYLYPCTKFRMALVYKFNARLLWIVYSISIALAVMGVVVGALALRENGGVVRDAKFSSIVAATRGSGLGRVRWTDSTDGGASGGGDTVPEEVKGWRMGYGVVDAGAGDGRLEVVDGAGGGRTVYGFGFEGDVRQLRRTPSLVQLTTLGK
ncbi:hypothetical protein B0T13DRAFT_430341 [Neurospora crassa]|nr:hypothetical protein B0T13DRAFT_430341 [Neurospora crassa]